MEESPGECLIHYGDGPGCRRILLLDGAALHDLCAEGFKEARHHPRPAGARVFLRTWFGSAGNSNSLVPTVAAHGCIKGWSDHAYTWYVQEAFVDTPEELFHLFRLVISECWVDGDQIAVFRFEAEILVFEIAQALAEQ